MVVVPEAIAQRLRCPRCGEPCIVRPDAGDVVCPNSHRFAMSDGYLDFSQDAPDDTTGRTYASFGYEWNTFDDVRTEDEISADVYFKDVDFESLRGKIGLDAGCGKGRFTRFVAAHIGALVALDGSTAVQAAARNLAEFPGVTVVKSDLRTAPFAPESFDFVSSLGVLHHLADPEEGFRRLVALMAPGGSILLYLYSRPEGGGVRSVALSFATALRRVTVRLPHPVLKALCGPIAAFLYAGFVLPGRFGARHGIKALADLPMDLYRDKPLRGLVLDTFDRLSAPVEFRYVWSDLEPWFERAGLVVDAARDDTGWFVLAHRP
jgi:SAM-dependent methyltransferase